MWICLSNAFVSIVETHGRPGRVLVRARRRQDLAAFLEDADGARIQTTPERDYRFRVELPKDFVADIVREHVLAIDYGNFKASVDDHALHRMYETWWGDHLKLQRPVVADDDGFPYPGADLDSLFGKVVRAKKRKRKPRPKTVAPAPKTKLRATP